MALGANTVVEVRTAGNDTNGGAFVSSASGTDYSQQDNKNTATGTDDSTTDAVANGTTTITSATANFGTSIIGNIIYLQGGTGGLAAGWYQVITRTNATTITVDRTVATGTGITMNIGGALASLGMAGGIGLVTGNIIWVKAGTYTVSSASTNVSNGCFSSGLGLMIIEGYDTTRGDLAARPILDASGISNFTIINSTGLDSNVCNIAVDGNNLSTSRGFTLRGQGSLLKAEACDTHGFLASTNLILDRCLSYDCAAAFSGTPVCFYCEALYGTGPHFNGNCWGCFSGECDGTTDSFFPSVQNGFIINCVAYLSTRDGIRINEDNIIVANCILDQNLSVGINGNSRNGIQLLNNAYYVTFGSDTSGLTGKGVKVVGNITLTGSPFVDVTSNNIALNNETGEGASCRAAGYPGVLPLSGTGYQDLGILQHADPTPSGGESSSAFFG